MTPNARRRKIISRIFEILCAVAVLVALLPLALILFYVVKEGFGALNWAFFTQMPKPVGEPGGGMANAIVGTLILIGLAALCSRCRSAASAGSISPSIRARSFRRWSALPPTC